MKHLATQATDSLLHCGPTQHACDGTGMVEVWLQKLVDGMQGTVKNTIKRAYRNVQEMALEDFIFGHPAQIALLGIQFQWTADTQVSYASNGMHTPACPCLLSHFCQQPIQVFAVSLFRPHLAPRRQMLHCLKHVKLCSKCSTPQTSILADTNWIKIFITCSKVHLAHQRSSRVWVCTAGSIDFGQDRQVHHVQEHEEDRGHSA